MNLLVIVFDMTSEDTGFISEPPLVWLGQINISKLPFPQLQNGCLSGLQIWRDKHNMMRVEMIHKAQSPCKYSWTQLQLNYAGLRLWNREISLCDLEPASSILDSMTQLSFLPEMCPAPDNLEQYRPCLKGWREKLGGSEISSLA